ncbi:MAG TPA: hypothetical protein VN259_01910 [Xanthomonadales bacterium]|nr:hypothetical protein [Xanthomonadales bacterium]
MCRAARMQLAALLALSLPVTASAMADVESPRFQVHGEIQPQSRSDDGRFALGAELKVVPEQASVDGRFVIKAINAPEAGCDPQLELFANGFEGL